MNNFACPACGESIHPNAASCPHCGADKRSGWTTPSDDEGFDYDEFVQSEFGKSGPRPRHISPFWWIVAILVLLAFALLTFGVFR